MILITIWKKTLSKINKENKEVYLKYVEKRVMIMSITRIMGQGCINYTFAIYTLGYKYLFYHVPFTRKSTQSTEIVFVFYVK